MIFIWKFLRNLKLDCNLEAGLRYDDFHESDYQNKEDNYEESGTFLSRIVPGGLARVNFMIFFKYRSSGRSATFPSSWETKPNAIQNRAGSISFYRCGLADLNEWR